MLVQCTYGPTTTEIMGSTYTFAPDEYGRCVAEVHDRKHAQVLTSVVHYRVVARDPAELTLTSIDPTSAVLGSEDTVLTCTGTGFAPDSVIIFAGQIEPAKFVSETEITTIVKPSLGWGVVSVPVLVRRYDLSETDPLEFSFTEAAAPLGSLPDDSELAEDEVPLTKIHGIGKALAHKLTERGVTVADIADWSKREAQEIDDALGLNGRIERDGWIEQAKALTG
jgi:hypothetical protein